MNESTALEVIDVEPGRFVPALAITPDQALNNYRAFQEFRTKVLRHGTDYSTIPGTDKPSLLKPGAEKLASAFAFAVEFILTDKVVEWERGFFHFEYECRLTHRPTRTLVATCIGSANSKEARYRWRTLPVWKASEEDKARAVRTEERRKKDGGSFTVYIVENDYPYTLVNTLQKMAQKRAFVGAVLIATNASDSFTQDVEDYAAAEGDDRGPRQANGERPTAKRESPVLTGRQVTYLVNAMVKATGKPEPEALAALDELCRAHFGGPVAMVTQDRGREVFERVKEVAKETPEPGVVDGQATEVAPETAAPVAEPEAAGNGDDPVDWKKVTAWFHANQMPVALRDEAIALWKLRGYGGAEVSRQRGLLKQAWLKEPDQVRVDIRDMLAEAKAQAAAAPAPDSVPF